MEQLPIPVLYRITNNEFAPTINSIWINECGNMVKVTKIYPKKLPTIVCFKNIESRNNEYESVFSISLQRFYSLFSHFEN